MEYYVKTAKHGYYSGGDAATLQFSEVPYAKPMSLQKAKELKDLLNQRGYKATVEDADPALHLSRCLDAIGQAELDRIKGQSTGKKITTSLCYAKIFLERMEKSDTERYKIIEKALDHYVFGDVILYWYTVEEYNEILEKFAKKYGFNYELNKKALCNAAVLEAHRRLEESFDALTAEERNRFLENVIGHFKSRPEHQ